MRTLATILLLAIFFVTSETSATSPQPLGVRLSVYSLAEPSSTFLLPPTPGGEAAHIELRVVGSALTHAQWWNMFGIRENGGPVWSTDPFHEGATFYPCEISSNSLRTAFPPINRKRDTSFIAVKYDTNGVRKVWINAVMGAWGLQGGGPAMEWEYQVRYFSGTTNRISESAFQPEVLKVGVVPNSGNIIETVASAYEVQSLDVLTSLYRVNDALIRSSNSDNVDSPLEIVPTFGVPLSALLHDGLELTPGPAGEKFGLVADGVTPLLLKFTLSGPARERTALKVNLELIEGLLTPRTNTNTDVFGPEIMKRLRVWRQTNALTGGFLPPGASDLIEFPKGQSDGFAYITPIDAQELFYTPSGVWGEIAVRVSVDVPLSFPRKFWIRRPPVALVHGYNATSDTWANSFLERLELHVPKDFILPVDYGLLSSFAGDQVAGNTFGRLDVLARELDQVLRTGVEFKLKEQWAFTRYDTVGHSQGGVLLRLLCAHNGNFSERRFRDEGNFYRGRFRRVITIGSPHQGSSFMRYGLQLRSRLSEKIRLPVIDELLQPKFDPWGGQLSYVNRFEVDANAKIHTVQTEVLMTPIVLAHGFVGLNSCLPATTLLRSRVVFPKGSDAIVDFESQSGGARRAEDPPSSSYIAGVDIAHADRFPFLGVLPQRSQTTATNVAEHLKTLLSSAEFAGGGFPALAPLPLEWRDAIDAAVPFVQVTDWIQEQGQQQNVSVQATSATNSFFFDFDVQLSRQERFLFAHAYGPDGLTTDGIEVLYSTDSSRGEVRVAEHTVGDVVLFGSYVSTNGNLIFAEPVVVTSRPPSQTLTGIEVLPADITMSQGDQVHVEVWGIYDNGTRSRLYIGPDEELNFYSNNDSIATADPNSLTLAANTNGYGGMVNFGLYCKGMWDDASVYVRPQTDLRVTGNSPTNSIERGAEYTYTITVVNAGFSDAERILVKHSLPDGAEFVSATRDLSGLQVTNGISLASTLMLCELEALPAGAAVEITVVVRAWVLGPLNQTISLEGPFHDTDYANNYFSLKPEIREACTFSLSAASREYPIPGGEAQLFVTAPDACAWAAYTDVPWIRLRPTAGNGDGWLTYAVAPNSDDIRRIGTIRVGDQVHVVYQAGRREQSAPFLPPLTDGTINAIDHCGDTTYVGGKFTKAGNHTGSAVAFDLTTGAMVPGFPLVNGPINVAIADGQGGWYIGGRFTEVGEYRRTRIARVRADFSVDEAFNPEIELLTSFWFENRYGSSEPRTPTEVKSLYLAENELYIGGLFKNINGVSRWGLASVDATTGSVNEFNPSFEMHNIDPDGYGTWDMAGAVHSIVIIGDLIYCGGAFNMINREHVGTVPQERTYLACVRRGNGAATDWDPRITGSPGVPNVLKLWNDVLLIGGEFGMAQVDVSSATRLPWNVAATLGGVHALAVAGEYAYVGLSGGGPVPALVLLNLINGTIEPWNPQLGEDPVYGLSGAEVRSLHLTRDRLYCAGAFRYVNLTNERVALCSIDVETATADTFQPSSRFASEFLLPSGQPQSIRGMSISSNRCLMVGDFISYNAQNRRHLAAYDSTTGFLIDNWKAAVWAFGNYGDEGEVDDLLVTDNGVYVAGDFTDAGTGEALPWQIPDNQVSRTNLAAFDPVSGAVLPWNPTANAPVYALAVVGDTIYAAGAFSRVNGVISRNFLAAFDDVAGLATAWNPHANNIAKAMLTDGELIYAAGHFTSVNQTLQRRGAAAFDPIRGIATDFNPNIAVSSLNGVECLELHHGTLYAGGRFFGDNSVNGTLRRNYAAAFEVRTGRATAWDPDLDGPAYALAGSGEQIWAGGSFSNVNKTAASQPRRLFAAFNANNGQVTPVNAVDSWTSFRHGAVRTIDLASHHILLGGTFGPFDSSMIPIDEERIWYDDRFTQPGSGTAAFRMYPEEDGIQLMARPGAGGTHVAVSASSSCNSVLIEASDDLINWRSIGTNTPPFSVWDDTGFWRSRFFRGTVVP